MPCFKYWKTFAKKIIILRVSLTIKNLNCLESVYRLNKKSWRKQAEATRTKLLWLSRTRKSTYFTKTICLEFPLLNPVWLNNTIHFGMRGCREHRDLCWGDVKLCKDAQGNEYLVYNERQTKTRSGVDGPWVIRPFNFQFKIKNWKSMSIFDFPFFSSCIMDKQVS